MEMNSLKTSFMLSFVLLHFGTGIIAQSQDSSEHLIREQHHKHPNNEIGLANHMVYLGNEQEFSYGIHIHYLRGFYLKAMKTLY